MLKHGLPLGIAGVCCWLVWQRLEGVDLGSLNVTVRQLAPHQWTLALAATFLSFLALARYDVIAHRHFRTGVATRAATISGATSIALGQTLGAGAIVGSFVRWRMHPELGLFTAAKITGFVTLTFLSALAVAVALVALILPEPHLPGWASLLILCAACALGFAAFFYPVLRLARREIALPTLPAMGALLLLCLADTLAAGLAFYALLPVGTGVTLAVLLPVFLIALGLAILSGTPGGMGPFELTLLAMLPEAPQLELMAAILAFRLVYYALPAVIAVLCLLRPLRADAPVAPVTRLGALGPALTAPTAREELGVLRQNGGAMILCGRGQCGVVRTGQTLTALFDPLDIHSGDLTRPLRRMARAQNRIVCKYKITARQAVHARRAGWALLHIADEALICTATHDLQGAAYRQLRRKLRQADRAGVTVSAATGPAQPLSDMRRLSHAWEDTHGVARGFSMGRFEEDYVAGQRVFLAHAGGALVGFITLHASRHEWCLDLMRVRHDAPDGTMHLLVQHAIEAARAENVPCMSLAAVPAGAKGVNAVEAGLRRKFDQHANGPGLRQFKACFAPRWQPLFMAAPSWAQLVLAACDLIRSVRANGPKPHPIPLPAPPVAETPPPPAPAQAA